MRWQPSVIVPTFNRREKVLRCLRALPEGVETIVVDDGSTDGTPHAIEQLHRARVKVLRQPRQGPAAARNRGVQESTGNLLLFTDDDCVPAPNWIESMTLRFEADDAALGGVGGRVLAMGTDTYSRYYVANRILEPPPTLSYVVTANCAITRKAFEAAGGFPREIRRPGGEDPVLSKRLRAAGFRLDYEPKAVVHHEFRQGFLDFVQTFFRYGRGCAHVVDG